MLALRLLLLHVLLPTARAAAPTTFHDASAVRPLHVKVAVLNAHLEGNLGDEV